MKRGTREKGEREDMGKKKVEQKTEERDRFRSVVGSYRHTLRIDHIKLLLELHPRRPPAFLEDTLRSIELLHRFFSLQRREVRHLSGARGHTDMSHI
eukprot:1344533-Amorphochlora_amoeboformis.AAC.1